MNAIRFNLSRVTRILSLAIASAAIATYAMDIGVCAHVGRDEFDERERAFDMMREAGISWVRTDFEWFRCQKEPGGAFDFSRYDIVVDDARARGLEVLPLPMGAHRESPEKALPDIVRFCDYSSAGNTWDSASSYRVWLPLECLEPARPAI